jgi:hypothetical protein
MGFTALDTISERHNRELRSESKHCTRVRRAA